MVEIEAGTFEMGCKPERDLIGSREECYVDELPAHMVKLPAFGMSQYEITFEEYDYYFWHQGSPDDVPAPPHEGWGHGDRPVINVSWNEASSYAEWLSEQREWSCRLPTESEWEYAARAGSESAFSWGKEVGKNQANCNGCGSQWDDKKTAPVGSFAANKFGLHDMHGNVWEWVQDNWHENYQDAPTDGSVWQEDDGGRRVLRGGSWYDTPNYLRSAYRSHNTPGVRFNSVGFRVVCSPPSDH